MTYIHKILTDIVLGVSWTKIFYFAFAILCIYIIQKLLDFKISDLISTLFREFKSLAAADINRGAINALGVIIFAVMALMYLFLDSFRSVMDAFDAIQGNENQTFFEFVLLSFMLAVLTLLSVKTVR